MNEHEQLTSERTGRWATPADSPGAGGGDAQPDYDHVIGFLNSRFRHSREQERSMAEAVERAYSAHVEICAAVIAHDAHCTPEAMERSIDDLRRRLVDQARRLVAGAEERTVIMARL